MPPHFSVIIPAHNEEKYLLPTLQSLERQTHQDFEVIVVANGCTDKTEELVKKKQDDKLRLLSLPHANVSVARNAGALNATGEMLLFLDADTQLAENSLELVKRHFSDHAIASVWVRPDTPKLKFHLAMMGKNLLMATKLYKGFGGTLICRRKDFQQVGGYNPELSVKEHHDLRKRLQQFGPYSCIPAMATTSMRRFTQWSLTKTAFFWGKQWLKYYQGKQLNGYDKIR